MRVISGTSRGKKLVSLEGLETRPTLDRVKEALFNILQFDIKDSKILDLFSGSGALAIEALSRGASKAVINDDSNKAIKVININLENTRLKDKAIVYNKNYIDLLNELKDNSKQFDFIFLDPPYKSDYAVKSIERIIGNNLLAKNGTICVETDDKLNIEKIEQIENIKIYDIRQYGRAFIILIRKG